MNNLAKYDSARNILAYYGFEGYSNECESGESDFAPKKAITKGKNNNLGMFLFPNPAKEEVQLIVEPEFLNGTLSISNAFGDKVISLQLNSLSTKLNLQKLNPGIYFIQIKSLNGTIEEKKLIVQ